MICSISGDTIKLFIYFEEEAELQVQVFLSFSFYTDLYCSSTLVRTPFGRCWCTINFTNLAWIDSKSWYGNQIWIPYSSIGLTKVMYKFLSVEVLLKSLPILVIHPTTRLALLMTLLIWLPMVSVLSRIIPKSFIHSSFRRGVSLSLYTLGNNCFLGISSEYHYSTFIEVHY